MSQLEQICSHCKTTTYDGWCQKCGTKTMFCNKAIPIIDKAIAAIQNETNPSNAVILALHYLKKIRDVSEGVLNK